MTKNVNLKNLQDSLTRTKRYIDDKGGAMVYRTVTTLADGAKYIVLNSSNTGVNPVQKHYYLTDGTDNGTYWTMWGQSANNTNSMALSDDISNYDEIEIDVQINGTSSDGTYYYDTRRIKVSDLVNNWEGYMNEYYPLVYPGDFGVSNSVNTGFVAGLVSKTRLGFGWAQFHTGVNNVAVFSVKGIKYTPLENYSTTEQVVGTWTDGRPIYQKTIPITPNGFVCSSTQDYTQTLITGIDQVIDYNGYFGLQASGGNLLQYENVNSIASSRYDTSNTTDHFTIFWWSRVWVSNTGTATFIARRCDGATMTLYDGYVTIKYIKR